MEVNRGVFLLILIFFLLSPAGNHPRLMSAEEREILHRFIDIEEYEMQVVANSTDLQSGYGNLTGLNIPYSPGPVSPFNKSIIPTWLYDKSHRLWQQESDNINAVFISNVSSTLKGHWNHMNDVIVHPINITTPDLSLDTNLKSNGSIISAENVHLTEIGNLTGISGGNIHFSLYEHAHHTKSQNISLISMEISFMDNNFDGSQSITLKGIHWKDTGNIILATQSLKFSGFSAIPHFLFDDTSQSLFNQTRNEVVNSLNRTINNQMDDLYYGIYEESSVLASKCEYIVYGHIMSSKLDKNQLSDAESELRDPQGRPHKHLDLLHMETVLYSPDCGQALYTSNVVGEKYETYYGRMRHVLMMGVALLLLETVCMAKQMKDTNTPSTISKVSFYSICLMALLDGSICMSSLVSSFLDEVALPFMAVAFVSFALTSMFEMRYMVLIHRSQSQESIADERARQATVEGQGAFVARSDGTIGPQNPEELPQTEPRTQTNPVERDEHQTVGIIYSRFYFGLLLFLLVSLIATSWPITIRRIYEYLVVFILYSIWIPQIYRNVMRGARKAFLWNFIISFTVIRYIPVLYLCLDTNNVLRHHYDLNLAVGIALYLWAQVTVLICQHVFGPRFFLPKGTLPGLYDYHPVITEEDLESGFDLVSNSSPVSNDKNDSGNENSPLIEGQNISVDCAICMNPVIIPMVPKDQVVWARNNPASILSRRKYMITPCRHVYHTECMEHWMRTRLQCPICRNPLPPI